MGQWLRPKLWEKFLRITEKWIPRFKHVFPQCLIARSPFVIRSLRQENLGWHRLHLHWYTHYLFLNQLVSWNLYPECSLCTGYEKFENLQLGQVRKQVQDRSMCFLIVELGSSVWQSMIMTCPGKMQMHRRSPPQRQARALLSAQPNSTACPFVCCQACIRKGIW